MKIGCLLKRLTDWVTKGKQGSNKQNNIKGEETVKCGMDGHGRMEMTNKGIEKCVNIVISINNHYCCN